MVSNIHAFLIYNNNKNNKKRLPYEDTFVKTINSIAKLRIILKAAENEQQICAALPLFTI